MGLIFFVIRWLYLLGMSVSTVAESSKKTRFIASTNPSMASFLPMEARQWGGNLLACRQASKWARRAKVWMFESIIARTLAVKYVKWKNVCKMAL